MHAPLSDRVLKTPISPGEGDNAKIKKGEGRPSRKFIRSCCVDCELSAMSVFVRPCDVERSGNMFSLASEKH